MAADAPSDQALFELFMKAAPSFAADAFCRMRWTSGTAEERASFGAGLREVWKAATEAAKEELKKEIAENGL